MEITAAEIIIKDNATWLTPSPEFFLADKWWFNESADKQTYFPVLLMDNDVSERLTIGKGAKFSVYTIGIQILHDYPVNDPEGLIHDPQVGGVRHTAVTQMRQLARELISFMQHDTRIIDPPASITDVNIVNVYNMYDRNLDGVAVKFNLRLPADLVGCIRHNGPKVVGYAASGYIDNGYVI